MTEFIVTAVFVLFSLTAWIVNFVKFTECDFQAPVRCEAIHGVGFIPGLSMLTVWFDSDKE